jgi:hypothetical protein
MLSHAIAQSRAYPYGGRKCIHQTIDTVGSETSLSPEDIPPDVLVDFQEVKG